MIDRLRLVLNRPLEDGERSRLFAAAAAVIVAAGIAFALLDDAGPSAAPSRKAPATPGSPTSGPAGPAELPAQPAPLEAPSEEGMPPPAVAASRAQVAQAKRAARRFLAGYLPYAYGQASARRIHPVSARLRQRLTRDRPRVSARERRRRPHVELLQAEGVSRRHAKLAALVSDGARRYTVPLELELERTSGGWTVTDVGS